MPDTTSIQAGTRLSRLKAALLDERRVLELDAHTARAGPDALLGNGLSDTCSLGDPIVVISTAQALL